MSSTTINRKSSLINDHSILKKIVRTDKNDISFLSNSLLHLVFIVLIFATLIPFALLIIVSLSDNSSVLTNGFQFTPEKMSAEAYVFLFKTPKVVFNAYKITIFTTVFGTIIHLTVASFYAYAISKKEMPFQRFFTFFLFFTMLFHGGMVASYIVNTKILMLKNNIMVLILPIIMNAWHILILRTYFVTSIPKAMEDAAKIDGAGDFKIFFHIVLPLAKPALATIALFQTLIYWNEWFLSLLYITKEELYTIQFVMMQTMRQIEKMQELLKIGATPEVIQQLKNTPRETVRFAMVVVAVGPIIFAYPFFQRYFVKGMTIGSVKG